MCTAVIKVSGASYIRPANKVNRSPIYFQEYGILKHFFREVNAGTGFDEVKIKANCAIFSSQIYE